MIDQLIDRDYFTVHVSTDLAEVAAGLRERPCFVVLNDRLTVLGIVTQADLRDPSEQRLDQVDFIKPTLTRFTSARKTILLMRSSGNNFLPVYQGKRFIGTLSLIDLADYLATELYRRSACRKPSLRNR